MQRLLEEAIEYARTRSFGKSIGKFQAVSHRTST
jgi:alkylation response protein AidB-like acyl-CoA dehydrogenase